MKMLKPINSEKSILVDDEDYAKCSVYDWYVKGNNKAIYRSQHPEVALSKFILRTKSLIDHKDRNIWNNQKENLRICTLQQNNQNISKRSPNEATSTYKGVYWNKEKKCWKAHIRVNYKRIHIGYFDHEENAAKAYDKAAIKYFKEFAFLNFPEEVSK